MSILVHVRKRWELGTLMLAVMVVGYGIHLQREAVITSLTRLYDVTGATAFILLPLTIALVTAVIYAWMDPAVDRARLYKTLGIVAALSPMAGFLGTTFGLMEAISALGQAKDMDALLEMVGQTLQGMAVALSTTSWGLVLTIIALFTIRMKQPAGPTETQPVSAGETDQLLKHIEQILLRLERQGVETHADRGRKAMVKYTGNTN